MKQRMCLVAYLLLMPFVSACTYNGPAFTLNVLVDEPRGPVHSEVICAGCSIELAQECLKESARNIGFDPQVSGTTFFASNSWHITPRKLEGTFQQVDEGVIVQADIDARMPITKQQLSYEFVAYMNKCNARRVSRLAS